MKRCPACATTFDRSRSFCPQDGAELVAVGPDAAGEPLDTTPMRTAPAPRKATAMLADGRTSALTPDEALIGQIVADRYQIESLIGRGGMGIVYRARHLMLGRHIAIKFLRHQFISDERAVGRFMREAQAMARIDHPNATHVYDFGVLPNGVAYIAMEMIEGEPLRSVLARSGPLPAEDALAVMEQVCGAVEAAHREGVIHRDLKPENIMLKQTEAGAVVKVVDFGLAKIADGSDSGSALTAAGELFGTPAYMAPEFFQGEEIDARADVYALGSIAYEVLTGRPPFQGTVQTVIGSQLFKDPPELSAVLPEVSDQVSGAVACALRKERDERPESAVAFAALLHGYDEPRPSAGLPVAISTIVVQPIAEVTGSASVSGNSSAITIDPGPRRTYAQASGTGGLSGREVAELLGDETGRVDLSDEALLDAFEETVDADASPGRDAPTEAIEAPRRRGAAAAAVSVLTAASMLGVLATSYRATSSVPVEAITPAPALSTEPALGAADGAVAAAVLPEDSEVVAPEGAAPPTAAKPARSARPRGSQAPAPPADDRAAPSRDEAKGSARKPAEKKEPKRRWFDPRRWF